jgi:hypothetical protein
MLLRFQKAAVRKNYETGNQACSIRLRFLTTRGLVTSTLLNLLVLPTLALRYGRLELLQRGADSDL